MNYHSLSIKEIFQELKTSEKGLTNKETSQRLRKYGFNEISKKREKSLVFLFLKQFHNPILYILFVAMVISFVFNHFIDAYVILAVLLINAIIGFYQERKAENAINALEKLIISYAKVIRNDDLVKIPSDKVVPGDIILLEEGDRVPADSRLIETKNFRIQESSLTGESFPVEKKIRVLDKSVSLGDRINMIFMGTSVVSGSARAVIVATGDKTAIGQIAESIQEVVHPKMHLNEKVKQLSIQISIFAFIGAALTFIIGFFINKLEFVDIFLFTIAALISGIPEGLPAVLIIVLSIGANRMAKKRAIIRHLPAIETLGVATVIATDKTGTLTENSITVEKVLTYEGNFEVTGKGWDPNGKFSKNRKEINPLKFNSLKKFLEISALCNKGNLIKEKDKYNIVGDPTEVSLLILAKKAGLDKKISKEKVIDDFSFNSDLKFRASLVDVHGKNQVYTAGAFETILEKSSYIHSNKNISFDKKLKKEFFEKAGDFAGKGNRIIALAYRDVPKNIKYFSNDLMRNLVFVGLAVMKDPPRKGVKESIQKAKNAGIRVIMKTGDHKETAVAIAREIGLVSGNAKVLTELDLSKMSEKEFRESIRKVNIFARVTPKMKMKIVKTLQEQGEIVAMTGDGVNDAPALKKADIGISMGIIGTDVAKESSEMVLANDNFSSIVDAVEEGRIVFRNLRQTSFYLITTNVAEEVTIISLMVMNLPLPLLPIQLLYLNLVTDTFSGVSLAMEPGHNDVLSNPPRDKKENILNKGIIPFLIISAGLMVMFTIPLFLYFLPQGIDKARTVAFVAMSMFQLFNLFNMRSLRESVFKIGFFSNKYLILLFGVSFALMLGVIYIPAIQSVFRFIPLSFMEFLVLILISSTVFIVGEIYKRIKYRD